MISLRMSVRMSRTIGKGDSLVVSELTKEVPSSLIIPRQVLICSRNPDDESTKVLNGSFTMAAYVTLGPARRVWRLTG
jgi:hypothetical protein